MLYTIKLDFHNKRLGQETKENICAWYCGVLRSRGLDPYHTSATRISFELDRDRTLAYFMLCNKPPFTPKMV
jgi:hypothetical protein